MCDNSTLHLFGTPNSFGANPSKLHTLGWKHKVELEDGIETMYEWYLNNKKESN